MTTQITPTEIATLRELLEKATPGPWRVVLTHHHGHEVRSEKFDITTGTAEPDAELIATLRNVAPDLIAEVERLRGENDDLRILMETRHRKEDSNAIDSLRRENEGLARVAKMLADALKGDESAKWTQVTRRTQAIEDAQKASIAALTEYDKLKK